jgi:hypothetical protein
MLRLTAAAVALVAAMSPAMSQTSTPAGSDQVTVPSAQNSGAGVPGQPGSENGPAVRPPSATSGTGATSSPSSSNEGVREQDSANMPGEPGSEGGMQAQPQPGSTGR